ncbi:MAG: ABC transporter ATP-binding protein, partial [Lachnospiraceae bacterium]|nr:ABC transporter ATP-binding protein [Lachnospiraceae bacterium]
GETGAGNSTLMSMLFGMYEPDSGEIYSRGRKEDISSPGYAAGLNIGMVHQHFKLVSNYTVTENIILGNEPKKKLFGFIPTVDMAKAEKDVAVVSKLYGLDVDPKDVISEMSVSARQRVEILKMLYRGADILIFDEPTAVLTPQEIESLLQTISLLRKSGKTIILITHKLEEIKKIADRCAILRRGKLIDVKSVKEMDTKEMARLMVGREVFFNVEKKDLPMGREVLQVKNLTVKNADGFPVVKNVSFSVHAGEIFAIAGVSENGQTEIADALAGLLKTAGGDMLLNGKSLLPMSIRERIEAGVAYIPEDRQEMGLILDFDLKDNLALKKYYHEPFSVRYIRDDSQFVSYGNKLIEEYDIRCADSTDTIVRSMSGGNQQKAIVGREIEQDTDLIIFVQPTRGLDIGAIERVHEQIVGERDRGKAVLLISLELDEVMDLADTIAVIYSGELLKIAPAKEYTTEEVGEYMMGTAGNPAGRKAAQEAVTGKNR